MSAAFVSFTKMSSADISVQSPPTDAVSVDVSSVNISGKIVAPTAGQGIKRGRSLDDMSDIIDQVASGFTAVTGKKTRRLDKSKNKSTVNPTNDGKPTQHSSSQHQQRASRQQASVNNADKRMQHKLSPDNHVDFHVSSDSIIDLLDKVESTTKISIATQTDLSASDLCLTSAVSIPPLIAGGDDNVLSTCDCSMLQNIEKCMLATVSPLSSDVIALGRQLLSLTSSVEQLSARISKLSSQVSSVISGPDESDVNDCRDGDANISRPVSSASVASVQLTSSQQVTGNTQPDQRNEYPRLKWSAVVSGQTNTSAQRSAAPSTVRQVPQAQQHNAMRQDVMTSVYLDLSLKERRAKNIVISGLANSSSDTDSVQHLLHSECNYSIPVVSCRRIGRPSEDRIQPIVVTLQSKDDARYLVENAKLLRESNDPVVRSGVYLNADLTPSEARAAYELRCRRRERTQNRATAPGSRFFYRSVADVDNAAPLVKIHDCTQSTLNPLITPFSPMSSTSGQSLTPDISQSASPPGRHD